MAINDKRAEIKEAIAEIDEKIEKINSDIEATLEQLAHADSNGKQLLAGKYDRFSKILDALEGDRLENSRRLIYINNLEFAKALVTKPE